MKTNKDTLSAALENNGPSVAEKPDRSHAPLPVYSAPLICVLNQHSINSGSAYAQPENSSGVWADS